MTDEEFRKIWQDQVDFNLELRPDPLTLTDGQRSQLTGDLALHLIDEVGELLRHVKWKKNRRNRSTANAVMVREELIDIFKMWMTLAQVWEPDLDALMDSYWAKSAVVRRRHTEEFIRDSQRQTAVIDLDGVLADFEEGVMRWLIQHCDFTRTAEFPKQAWRIYRHSFYASGGFRELPLKPGARDFVQWCRLQGWNVVFLTSRGIDRYPNILTDTVGWMQDNDLEADFVWWGTDKPAKLEQEEVLKHVVLVVDDDEQFIHQYVEAGIANVVHLVPNAAPGISPSGANVMPSLHAIMEGYDNVF